MTDDQPITTNVSVQSNFIYQTFVMMVAILVVAVILQITILSRFRKVETSLTNMSTACLVVAEKGKP